MKTAKSIIAALICLAGVSLCQAEVIEPNQFAIWGIGDDQITIPVGSVVTEAVLTISGCTSADAAYVHLLDDTDKGFAKGLDTEQGDYFAGYGVQLQGAVEEGNLVYRFSQNNDMQSPMWSVYPNPFVFTLAGGSSVQYSSCLLQALDYIGNGRGFGFGINPQQQALEFSGMKLVLTTASYQGQAATKILNYAYPAEGIPQPVLCEAENAILSGAVVSSVIPGFTGTGFADYVAAGGEYVEWTINTDYEGMYDLDFRYGLGNGDRPLCIEVNGAVINASLAFPATGGWTIWKTVGVRAMLNYGVNTVRAISIGYSGPNLDNMIASPVDVGFYEAENATLGGAVASSIIAGFTGTGFVDYVAASGEYTEWMVNASYSGLYELQFRYALGMGTRILSMEINGEMVNSSMKFSATSAWTTWKTVSIMAPLKVGVNTIRMTSTGSSGPNLDSLTITSQ